MKLLRSRHRHFVQDHLTFFSRATLGRLLENQGFEVVDAYWPTRRMTLRHLVVDWGGRFAPSGIASRLRSLNSGALNKIVPLNLGDIVAVVGRKTLDR